MPLPKGLRTLERPSLHFSRDRISNFQEIGDAVYLRRSNGYNIGAIGQQCISPPGIPCLLVSRKVSLTPIVLGCQRVLRPEQIANHPIATEDSSRLRREGDRLVDESLGSFSIQRVAAAKLVPERDEFSDRKGLSHLDEHHFWRANGYARSDFQERVARQGRGYLVKQYALS